MLAPCTRRTLNAVSLPRTFTRGLRNPGKGRTVMAQLTSDVPQVGAYGAVVEVNRGYMRNYLYPQRKANYITRMAGPEVLPGQVVSPFPESVVQKLRELGPIVFNRRLRTLTATAALGRHGIIPGMAIMGNGIKLSDVRAQLETLGFTGLDPPVAVLEFVDGRRKLRSLGKYQAQIKFLGYDEPVKIQVSVEPEQEKSEEDSTGMGGGRRRPTLSRSSATPPPSTKGVLARSRATV